MLPKSSIHIDIHIVTDVSHASHVRHVSHASHVSEVAPFTQNTTLFAEVLQQPLEHLQTESSVLHIGIGIAKREKSKRSKLEERQDVEQKERANSKKMRIDQAHLGTALHV